MLVIYNKRILIIVGIIVIIGILIWGAITGLTNFGDLLNGVSVESNDNVYGGKTIIKKGDKASFVETFPKEELPVIENGIVTEYKLDTDGENKVVLADLDVKVTESFEKVVEYYDTIYSKYDNYTKADSNDREAIVKMSRVVDMTFYKEGYNYTIKIEEKFAGGDKTEIKLVMEKEILEV